MVGPVKLAYEVLGSYSRRKSPLLIIHGILGSRSNWKTVGRKLSVELETEVYILDARNHGSSPHVLQMDYDLMCQDLVLFSQDHDLKETTVIGHSMGGKVAMQLALDYPQYLKKLVVLDVTPVPKPGLSDLHHVLPALLKVDLTTLHSRKEVDAALQYTVPSTLLRNFLLKSLVQDSRASLRWKFNLEAIANSYSTMSASTNKGKVFNGPTSFIGGAKSDYITQLDTESILELFPKASISHISDAGHWVHIDQPGEVIAAIKNFHLKNK